MERRIIDVHTHILPNVDDGSRGIEDTLTMLKNAKKEGVTDIVFTPHFRLDMFLTPASEDKRVFNEVVSTAKQNGININFYLGQELHYSPKMLPLINSGEALTINNGKYFLLEFSWHVPCDFVSIVKEYVEAGYTPIVVHFERFPYYSLETVRAMKNAGALMQINAFSLFKYEYPEHTPRAMEMLDNDLVDFIASDIHHYKKYFIKDAYEFITQKYGEKRAKDLFANNALKILGINE